MNSGDLPLAKRVETAHTTEDWFRFVPDSIILKFSVTETNSTIPAVKFFIPQLLISLRYK